MMMVVITLMSCSAVNADREANSQASTKTQTDKEMTKVELETTLGNIVVELYNETPQHRDNFIKLVKSGYYDGVLFHRVIRQVTAIPRPLTPKRPWVTVTPAIPSLPNLSIPSTSTSAEPWQPHARETR